MSSIGPRPIGTDGTDFKHRQRVAASIKLSVQYKFYLKLLFALHFLILLPLWAKVGGELIFIHFKLMKQPTIWKRIDLPRAYTWLLLLKLSYYSQFLFGITPCAIVIILNLIFAKRSPVLKRGDLLGYLYFFFKGLGSQFPELIDYIRFGEQSKVPTFSGNFPMVIIWYLFFLAVFQIQGFSMYFTFNLLNAWKRDPITLKQSAEKAQNVKKDE